MSLKPKRDLKTVVKAIKKNRGLMYRTALALKVNPRTLYNYAKKHKEVIQQAVDDARGEFVDQCELGLMGAVDREDPWAIQFALKTLGRKRGYIENDPATINAEIVINPYGNLYNRFVSQIGDGESNGSLEPDNPDADKG